MAIKIQRSNVQNTQVPNRVQSNEGVVEQVTSAAVGQVGGAVAGAIERGAKEAKQERREEEYEQRVDQAEERRVAGNEKAQNSRVVRSVNNGLAAEVESMDADKLRSKSPEQLREYLQGASDSAHKKRVGEVTTADGVQDFTEKAAFAQEDIDNRLIPAALKRRERLWVQDIGAETSDAKRGINTEADVLSAISGLHSSIDANIDDKDLATKLKKDTSDQMWQALGMRGAIFEPLATIKLINDGYYNDKLDPEQIKTLRSAADGTHIADSRRPLPPELELVVDGFDGRWRDRLGEIKASVQYSTLSDPNKQKEFLIQAKSDLVSDYFEDLEGMDLSADDRAKLEHQALLTASRFSKSLTDFVHSKGAAVADSAQGEATQTFINNTQQYVEPSEWAGQVSALTEARDEAVAGGRVSEAQAEAMYQQALKRGSQRQAKDLMLRAAGGDSEALDKLNAGGFSGSEGLSKGELAQLQREADGQSRIEREKRKREVKAMVASFGSDPGADINKEGGELLNVLNAEISVASPGERAKLEGDRVRISQAIVDSNTVDDMIAHGIIPKGRLIPLYNKKLVASPEYQANKDDPAYLANLARDGHLPPQVGSELNAGVKSSDANVVARTFIKAAAILKKNPYAASVGEPINESDETRRIYRAIDTELAKHFGGAEQQRILDAAEQLTLDADGNPTNAEEVVQSYRSYKFNAPTSEAIDSLVSGIDIDEATSELFSGEWFGDKSYGETSELAKVESKRFYEATLKAKLQTMSMEAAQAAALKATDVEFPYYKGRRSRRNPTDQQHEQFLEENPGMNGAEFRLEETVPALDGSKQFTVMVGDSIARDGNGHSMIYSPEPEKYRENRLQRLAVVVHELEENRKRIDEIRRNNKEWQEDPNRYVFGFTGPLSLTHRKWVSKEAQLGWYNDEVTRRATNMKLLTERDEISKALGFKEVETGFMSDPNELSPGGVLGLIHDVFSSSTYSNKSYSEYMPLGKGFSYKKWKAASLGN